MQTLAHQAFVKRDPVAARQAQLKLYAINTALLAEPWANKEVTNDDRQLKHHLEQAWETSERERLSAMTAQLPNVNEFHDWIQQNMPVHPIFHYLEKEASYSQLKEYVFQESPLEMFFADILAMLLAGTYGQAKMELVANYWDELGRGQEHKVHRNLRIKLSQHFGLSETPHLDKPSDFITEELELINFYFSSAMTRSKQTWLMGALLANEMVIPDQFTYLVNACQRLGIPEHAYEFYSEHVTVDEQHAEHWLQHVVSPLLQQHPNMMPELVFGVARRLDVVKRLLDNLYNKILSS